MSRRTARRGFALFLSILLLLVLTISGVALMFNTSVEDTLSGVETKISKTFYAADSGIQFASAALQGPVLPAGTQATQYGASYKGGQVPVGIFSNYPGHTLAASSNPAADADINIVVSQPVLVGSTIHQKDQLDPHSQYGGQQIVENVYYITSTANSTSLQSQKTITAQVGIYPMIQGVPQ